jgi:hypothetical protein
MPARASETRVSATHHVESLQNSLQIYRTIYQKLASDGKHIHARASLRCPLSKLSPHEFIDGFEHLAIAWVHGDADKRSGPGRPKQTPNPHRVGAGIDRYRKRGAGYCLGAGDARDCQLVTERNNFELQFRTAAKPTSEP